MPKRRDRKVLTHRKGTHSAPPKLCRTRKHRRPEPRRKQWTDEQMNEALKAVRELVSTKLPETIMFHEPPCVTG